MSRLSSVQPKVTSQVNDDLDLDLINGPTEEFARHHETTYRAHGPGRRTLTRLEQLLMDGLIPPGRHDAGRRFEEDYVRSGNASMPSSLKGIVAGAGGASDNDVRLDAGRAFRLAAETVNRQNPRGTAMLASDILVKFLVDKDSYRTIAATLGLIRGEDAKALICSFLVSLEQHYAAIDLASGRSRTPHTKEAALRMIEPKDPKG